MRARISSVAAQMEKFDFFFGVELGRKVLNVVDNLSRTLQATAISACEAQTVVSLTVTTLQSMRSDECFDMFWQYVEHRRASLDSDVLSQTLPRRRKTPRRYEIRRSMPEHPQTLQDHYRRIYFKAIDLIVSAIGDTLNQKGFSLLQKLEPLQSPLK